MSGQPQTPTSSNFGESPVSIKKGLCGPQNPSERYGEQKHLSTGIDSGFLGRPVRNTVPTANELSRLHTLYN